ncbi:hypothetical protein [Streptomyces sp. SID1034]|uniref:hypothetical protein n=1 Tax=Streptomyces sp. SID1034 TaxID=2690248 RepID=UPI001369055B|nr:hypothetical protein [Streptomyces sp. SID1034]MYV93351.1 hypothetical protein [Streptomyces sp. SID1034]
MFFKSSDKRFSKYEVVCNDRECDYTDSARTFRGAHSKNHGHMAEAHGRGKYANRKDDDK